MDQDNAGVVAAANRVSRMSFISILCDLSFEKFGVLGNYRRGWDRVEMAGS